MTVLHMSKDGIDNSDSEFLFNIMSTSMAMFTHFISGIVGNSNSGIGTGFSPSGVK